MSPRFKGRFGYPIVVLFLLILLGLFRSLVRSTFLFFSGRLFAAAVFASFFVSVVFVFLVCLVFGRHTTSFEAVPF